MSRACGGIRGRLTANCPLPACPAASLGQAALPCPRLSTVPARPDFPKQNQATPSDKESRLALSWGKTGLEGPGSLGGGQVLPRPSDAASSLVKH